MFDIRTATEHDIPLILQFIRDLAEYERMLDRVVATEEALRASLFGSPRFAEVIIGEEDGAAVVFALFFHNYSTFLGQPGIYLEDLFVKPEARGRGYGKALLARLAQLARGYEWHPHSASVAVFRGCSSCRTHRLLLSPVTSGFSRHLAHHADGPELTHSTSRSPAPS